jgi:hypothetical protein
MAAKTPRRRRVAAGHMAGQGGMPHEAEPMLAQVRLRAEESAAMQLAMARLHLGSTSEALREGLRLLSQEAVEVAAAEEIRMFYHGELAPVPAGVAPVGEADLAAADDAEW